MALVRNTQYVILAVAVLLFGASVVLTMLAGIGFVTAVIWNVLSSLYIYYNLIPDAIAASSPLILVATLLDAFVFALFTVFLATWFINLLRTINIREHFAVSRARKLKDQIYFSPYNSFSRALVEDLSQEGAKAIVIAKNDADAAYLNTKRVLAIVGDVKDKEVFMTAGVDRASYIVACDPSDVENAMIAITAKDVNPKIKVISRVEKEEDMQKLGKAGAYWIVLPGVTAGARMADEIIKRLM